MQQDIYRSRRRPATREGKSLHRPSIPPAKSECLSCPGTAQGNGLSFRVGACVFLFVTRSLRKSPVPCALLPVHSPRSQFSQPSRKGPRKCSPQEEIFSSNMIDKLPWPASSRFSLLLQLLEVSLFSLAGNRSTVRSPPLCTGSHTQSFAGGMVKSLNCLVLHTHRSYGPGSVYMWGNQRCQPFFPVTEVHEVSATQLP